MMCHLEYQPIVVAPVGGESGAVLRGLVASWGPELVAIEMQHDSPAYIHDRRSGKREEFARSQIPCLDRHEMDNFYGAVLDEASASGACVITGKVEGDSIPLDFYHRLGADLKATGVQAIGDLHGAELDAFLDGGPLDTLKVSDEDLIKDGRLEQDAPIQRRLDAIKQLRERGAKQVVISAAKGPTVAYIGGLEMVAEAPSLEAVDPKGSGDAMTAGLVAGVLEQREPQEVLKVACAAGAANVTRHGLGNVNGKLVESLSEKVSVKAT